MGPPLYHLVGEDPEAPGPAERELAGLAIVAPRDARQRRPAWEPFPSFAAAPLYLTTVEEANRDRAGLRFVQPVLAGRPSHLGLHGRPLGEQVHEPSLEAFRPRYDLATAPARGASMVAASVAGDPIRVAVIDWSFAGSDPFPGTLEAPPAPPSRFPRRPPGEASGGGPPGHGTSVAAVVHALSQRGGVATILGPFALPRVGEPYLYPTDLAAAVALAAADWRADVIVVPLANGRWGCPRHLQHNLAHAARLGRGGRGCPIFVAAGRADVNWDSAGSVALPVGDLASSPDVIAVGACTLHGRYYRRSGLPVSRLGAAIELAAPGDAYQVGGLGLVDDSSGAAAFAAAVAAQVLARHPELTLDELRRLLRMTATVPGAVEEPGATGPGSDRLAAFDRRGHNFKLGYGCVDGPRALLGAVDPIAYGLLASRGLPDGAPGSYGLGEALARRWLALVDERGKQPLGQGYLRHRRTLWRLLLADPRFDDGVAWLCRHTRALRSDGAARVDGGCGALVDRLRSLVDTVTATAGDADLCDWIAKLGAALDADPQAEVADLLTRLLDGAADEPEGG